MNINTYAEFIDSLEKSIIFRAKNFVTTDCDFENLVNDVYDDIMRDVKLKWITQTILVEKNVYNYELENDNTLEVADPELIEYYGETFDIVDEYFDDVSMYITEPETGIIIMDEDFVSRNIGRQVFLLRSKIPPLVSLDALLYRAIKTAMVEGLMFQIQDAIPSQIDGQLANAGYQRFFAAKKVLKEKYPQRKWLDGVQVGSQPRPGVSYGI